MTRAIIENKKIVGFEPIKEETKEVDKDEIARRQRGAIKKYNEMQVLKALEEADRNIDKLIEEGKF